MSDVPLPDGFFGSPDDDPLLQDDPLADAPASDASASDASGSNASGSNASTSEASDAPSSGASGDRSSTDASEGRQQPAPRAGTPLESDSAVRSGPTTAATPGGTSTPDAQKDKSGVPASLFRQIVPSGDPEADHMDETTSTKLRIPAREAAAGHLAPLRTALSQGWHLTNARITSPGPEEEKNLALTFTLKRRA